MKNKIEEGYVMNIQKNAFNDYIGGLILNQDYSSDDFIELRDEDMSFLEGMHCIDNRLSKGNTFSLSYDVESDLYVSEIKEKKMHADGVTWSTIIRGESKDFYHAIDELDKKIEKVLSKEEKLWKKI